MLSLEGGEMPNIQWSYALTLALVTPLLSSCIQDNRVAPLEARVQALEGRLSIAERRLANALGDVEELQRKIGASQFFDDLKGVVYLTPGSEGYGVVRMELGNLTVTLVNIAAYANGSRVTLAFGNLTSATIEGLKAKIEWGSVDEKGEPKNEAAKARQVTLNESLVPGAWSNTQIVLDGVPPTALGFIRVRDVSHRAIRLRGR
jgi:hypothetical protein